MRTIHSLAVLLLMCGAAFAEDRISSYKFTWTVSTEGNVKVGVEKTEEKTRIVLNDDSGYAWLSPADAEKVGKALEDVDAYYEKMKDGTKSEDMKIGMANVSFYSREGRFYVSVKSRGSISGVTLNRAQAKAAATTLSRSKRLAALVDEKIKL